MIFVISDSLAVFKCQLLYFHRYLQHFTPSFFLIKMNIIKFLSYIWKKYKKTGIQRPILFIAELFANIHILVFTILSIIWLVKIWYCMFWIIFYFIS